MPNPISNEKIHNFLLRHTIPIPLSSLAHDSLNCPICNNPYSEHDPSDPHPQIAPDAPEYPVQVVRCGSCSHIFGRVCIEKSIRARQPWSHVCPICRVEWFVPPHSTRTELLAGVRRCLNVLAILERNGNTSAQLEEVEGLLGGIETRLLERRWI